MSKLPTTTKTSSTLLDQSITASLTAEIMTDLDTGQPTLVASTQGNLSDLQEVVPARLLRMVAEARAKLDAIERLAQIHEAEDTLRAIIAEHQLHVEEWDIASLAPEHRGKVAAFAEIADDGQRTVVVPTGQDPIERVNAIAHLVNNLANEDQA